MPVRSRADNVQGAVEPLSPELVLVDPVLAAAARADLASYEAQLPDVFEVVERRRAEEAERPAPRAAEKPEPAVAPSPRRQPWRRWAAGVVLAGVAAGAGLALGEARDGDGSPTNAAARSEPRASTHTVTTTPSVARAGSRSPRRTETDQTRPPTSSAPGSASASVPRGHPRRTAAPTVVVHRHAKAPKSPVLAWSPSRGATFYRVRVFQVAGSGATTFLYEVWTRRPRLSLPLTWVAGGRRRRLGLGKYRWSASAASNATLGGGSGPTRTIAHGTVVIAS